MAGLMKGAGFYEQNQQTVLRHWECPSQLFALIGFEPTTTTPKLTKEQVAYQSPSMLHFYHPRHER